MKLSIFLTATLICSLQFSFSAQTTKTTMPASDAVSGYTYDYDKANELVIERLINPGPSNLDVKTIIDEKSFPKLSSRQKVDADYKKKVAVWIEKHPSQIISALKHRQEIVHPF